MYSITHRRRLRHMNHRTHTQSDPFTSVIVAEAVCHDAVAVVHRLQFVATLVPEYKAICHIGNHLSCMRVFV